MQDTPIMQNIEDGGPIAASIHHQIPMGGDVSQIQTLTAVGGLSIRDWFAGMALQGLTAHPEIGNTLPDEAIAAHAYSQADAMLETRKHKP